MITELNIFEIYLASASLIMVLILAIFSKEKYPLDYVIEKKMKAIKKQIKDPFWIFKQEINPHNAYCWAYRIVLFKQDENGLIELNLLLNKDQNLNIHHKVFIYKNNQIINNNESAYIAFNIKESYIKQIQKVIEKEFKNIDSKEIMDLGQITIY